jgi:hypothetical protein
MKHTIKYGLIIAAISILGFLVVYNVGFEILFTLQYVSLNILVTYVILPIVLFILACTHIRKKRNDFYFWEAYKTIAAGGIAIVVVLFAFNVIFKSVLAENYLERKFEAEKSSYFEMFTKAGMTEEQVNEKLDELSQKKQSIIKNETQSALGGVIWFLIMTLIIAAPNSDKKLKLEN